MYSSTPDFLSGAPYITSIPPIQYDAKGRQIQYVETPLQRRERLAFLRKREWARRVSSWIEESGSENVDEHYGRDVLYDSAQSISAAAARPPKVTWDVLSIPEASASDLSSYANDPESEPYIIYSSSPSSPSSSTSSLTLDRDGSESPSSPALKFPSSRTRHRRRHSSLSSINEVQEPEEN